MNITMEGARRFLLLKQGLIGAHRFRGKAGALSYVRQAGCIQFDPVDVIGKNAELVLQSRVKGFTKDMLWQLLYQDRALVDYPDKNMAIFPVEDWPYFQRFRDAARTGGQRFQGLADLEDVARKYIAENGPVNGDELPIDGQFYWKSSVHWSNGKNAARAALEQMYSTGELVIHHKDGSRKSYDLADRHIPRAILSAPDPLPDDFAHMKWRIRRRIGAIGLIWNRPSDAWLNIWGLDSEKRSRAFRELEAEGSIRPVEVEGIRDPLFYLPEDESLMQQAVGGEKLRPRCEVIAPLDCLMWDRKLIARLFHFQYSWEIYTPESKRKYGFYVLPLLWGDRFIGRVEAVREKGGLMAVKNIWLEDGVKKTKQIQKAVDGCMKRLAALNGCTLVRRDDPLSL